MSFMIPEETSFHHDGSSGGGRQRGILLADDDDDYENENKSDDDEEENENDYNPDDDGDGENFHPNLSKKKEQGMTTKIKDRRSLMKKQGSSRRRRRRSSARFLKIGPNDDNDNDDNDSSSSRTLTGTGTGGTGTGVDNLSEVYRNAIRMNAENRINAANSWNINLIDHLDRFVAPELRTGSNSGGSGLNASKRGFNTSTRNVTNTNNNGMDSTMDSTMTGGQSSSATGVNFTKASCTLDASVKIYSYRVDDVHLTSYKVLANLNRTETSSSNTATSKKKTGSNGGESMDGGEDNGGRSSNKSRSNTSSANTLEHNTSNINIHKLDAAFDIDPLFHKMSKNFDEGGAKGLLLANLSVGYGGCKIIFDSTLDDDDDNDDEEEEIDQEEQQQLMKNKNDSSSKLEDVPEDVLPQELPAALSDNTTVVDVTSLVTKLESLLISSGVDGGGLSSSGVDGINDTTTSDNNNNTIGSMSLVPQLASLRDQFAELKNDGFVDEIGISSKRYASSHEEEAEADKSIHLEAIERSRASLADFGRSLNARDAAGDYDDDDDGGGFDFGGGGDDDDDDFGDLHDGDHRFSSSSFQAGRTSFSSLGSHNGTNGNGDNRSSNNDNSKNHFNKTDGADNNRPSFLQTLPVAFSQATVLLDAIASGNISTMESTNHYEYFNSQALANLSSGNLWAGAEHWKKMRRKTNGGTGTGTGTSQDDTFTGGKDSAKSRKGRKVKSKALSSISSGRVAVLLNTPIDNLDELLLKKPSPPKKTGRGKADPLQLTKAMKTKYGKNDNLLPMDAGIDVKEFTTLFGRPKSNLMDLAKAKRDAALLASAGTNTRSTKVVGFSGVDDSYGDNDDGAGFNFGGGDDDDDYGDNDNPNEFVVPELDDVRKVNKIKIGYAKIAKKVDVKRLKRDLWTELEQTFAKNAINKNEEDEKAKNQDDDDALSTASTVSDPDPVLAGTSGGDENNKNENSAAETTTTATTLSFQDTVRDMQMNESQSDVTLPFYFICILHLCNEKGLALESSGLDDFIIHSS